MAKGRGWGKAHQHEKSRVRLDPEDEHLRPLISLSKSRAGNFYVYLYQTPLHRVVTQAPKGTVVDHLNGDTLDNRKANLRVTSCAINGQNTDRWNGGKRSNYRGVTPATAPNRWTARIKHYGAITHIGTYDTPEEANVARLLKERELWGVQPRREPAFRDAGLMEGVQ